MIVAIWSRSERSLHSTILFKARYGVPFQSSWANQNHLTTTLAEIKQTNSTSIIP